MGSLGEAKFLLGRHRPYCPPPPPLVAAWFGVQLSSFFLPNSWLRACTQVVLTKSAKKNFVVFSTPSLKTTPKIANYTEFTYLALFVTFVNESDSTIKQKIGLRNKKTQLKKSSRNKLYCF